MKKTMRTALLLMLLAALCLGLSGCENEEECIRQALIDMGYMSPTPEPDATPEPDETPEADVPSESQQTPEPGNFPDPGRIFDNIATPAPINPPDLGKLFDSGWGLGDKQSVESGAEAAVESAVPDEDMQPEAEIPVPHISAQDAAPQSSEDGAASE